MTGGAAHSDIKWLLPKLHGSMLSLLLLLILFLTEQSLPLLYNKTL
jgi:hypothetical protein